MDVREETIRGRGLRSLIDRPAGAVAVMKAQPFRKIASISLAVMLFLVLFMGVPANRAAAVIPAITLSPSNLPTATGDSSYNQTITAGGGTAPYTYTVSSGALPSGLTLSSGGALSGTVTAAAGSYSLTVQATDHYGNTGSKAYTLTVNSPAITLSPSSLSAGTSGAPYSASITAGGGTAPYTYTVSSGTLPSGLTLSSSGGALSGTITAAAGSYSFTVQAKDANSYTGAQSYTLTVNSSEITLSPSNLSAGTSGASYSAVITAAGGVPPYTYTIRAGALPTGLSLSSGGTLSGTVTAAAGSYSFTVQAKDVNSYTGSQSYTLTIYSALSVTTTTLPTTTEGVPYSQAITATGGSGGYTFTVSNGSLPAGLSLSGSNISGTPSAAGNYSFTVKVTDSAGNTATQSYTLTVISSDATLSGLTLSSGALSPSFAAGTTSYTANGESGVSSITVTPTVNDSAATVTVNGTAVTSGSASGPISLSVGTNTINVVVTAQDNSTTDTYTITIDTSLLAVTGSTPASGSTGVPTNQVVSVSFNKNIQAGSDYGGITFTDASGNSVSFAGSISGSTLTLSPAALNYNTSYIVSIPVGAVQDDAGNTLAATCTISFMTSEQGTPSSLIWQILICAQKDTGNDWTCNPDFSGIVQGTNDLGSTTISYQDTNGDGKNDQATVTIHGGYAGYYNSLSLTVVNLGSTNLPLSAVTIGNPDVSGLTTRLLAGASSHIQPGRRSVVGIDFRVNSTPGGDISFTVGL